MKVTEELLCQDIGRNVLNMLELNKSEFIKDAEDKKYDVFITGDLKYHTAVDSKIILIDIGHFESEKQVLKTLHNILQNKVELIYAKEKSPFNII